jgi:hypothetical protein
MMTLELAVRWSEIMLGFALLQQSLEFMRGQGIEKTLGVSRLLLALLLMLGLQPLVIETALLGVSLMMLRRFQGPYNGGSDAMTWMVLLCLWLSHLAPNHFWRELALGYLAFQLIWSYFQSGYIKIINPEWRSGQALRDVFAITAYPVSAYVRQWAEFPRLLRLMAWGVMGFELLFPFALVSLTSLLLALGIALLFHLANALLFGLNRFFWIWPAAYPVLIWFHCRLFG